ncbi:hypothetical protein [Vibrio scophthalmi]|uniref:Uncharacterized protein n=1 Tax=Vibrio scophthalmi LMG 19158 TaxID=870967 RepID=F9RP46_9VIBR|nr:hypothetical protein [Vibrio scophthalmi]EGU36153.1 hypothetical protein VIS19158_10359 [Vibrio scophthalmi LMG 19158]
MERKQLLVEVKSIIGHAVCTMRTGQSTQSQRDDALDNLASAMFAIEEYLPQLGSQHD